MRLINVDKLKEAIENIIDYCDINRDCCNCCYRGCIEKLDYDDVEEIINEQLTIEERPKGEWIYNKIGYPYVYTCSECGYHNDIKNRFCPYCGADMREQ